MRFNVTGFQLDPMPRGIGIEEKQRAFCSHLTKSQLYQMIFPIKLSSKNTRHRIKLEPRYVEAQGPILSFKVPFVKIGVAVWTLPGYNHFWQS